jgi:hypothetical protein
MKTFAMTKSRYCGIYVYIDTFVFDVWNTAVRPWYVWDNVDYEIFIVCTEFIHTSRMS